MINTVIFDFDGLLVDSEVIWYKVFQQMLDPFEKKISTEHYVQNYSGKTIVENMENLVKEYGLPYSTEEAVERVLDLDGKAEENGVPCKGGAYKLIQYLKDNNFNIVLATSSKTQRAVKILEKNGILKDFNAMAFGDQVKRGKPAPDIFLKAMEHVNEIPEHCLVLEDSESGIQAASNANMKVICIPDMKKPSDYHKSLTECILSNLEEIIPYLEKVNS